MTDTCQIYRLDFSVTITVISALHIGAGEVCDANDYPEVEASVSAIQRGGDEYEPYIPGSALKGALLATAREMELELELVDKIFGKISDKGVGSIGALIVRGSIQHKAGDARGLPFEEKGVFVSARTAIHDGVGVADQNKLFFAEAVAPDAEFILRLRLETRCESEILKLEILKILAVWTADNGVAIGADQTSGLGRIRLAEKVDIIAWDVMSKGGLATTPKTSEPLAANNLLSKRTEIKLQCKGLYLSGDPGWTKNKREAKRKADNVEHSPNTRALRRNKLPHLTGQSVSGALRSRQEWLEKIRALKVGKALPALVETLLDKSAALDLRRSERLFGVAGWRGVLRVAVLKTGRKKSHESTSVKIDRFSGGPIDNALFSTDSDYGVTATLEFTFDSRATQEDIDAFENLISEIKASGLQLGQGVNHGFGWFEVIV